MTSVAQSPASKRPKILPDPDDEETVENYLRRCAGAYAARLVEEGEEKIAMLKHEYAQEKQLLLSSSTSTILLTLKAIAGPHLNSVFSVCVGKECMLGRSSGSRFQPPYGVSLNADDEVSTTHARFSVNASGELTFQDVGSTNGSKLNERHCEGVEVLKTNDRLSVGQTVLEIVSVESAPQQAVV